MCQVEVSHSNLVLCGGKTRFTHTIAINKQAKSYNFKMALKTGSVSLQKEVIDPGPTQEGSNGSQEVARRLKKWPQDG